MSKVSRSALQDAAYDLARQFLELIAIVDDGELRPRDDATKARTPGYKPVVKSDSSAGEPVAPSLDSPIDYETISKAAFEEGVFCALVRPEDTTRSGAEAIGARLAKADIIVLDWRIKGDDGQFTSMVIEELRSRNPGRKRQVVCIYSDFHDPAEALRGLGESLKLPPELLNGNRLEARPLEIVWLAKTGIGPGVATPAAELPGALISEFASNHEGLLPLLALDALRRVRSNTLPILDRYTSEADIGFAVDAALLEGVEEVAPGVRSALADDLAVAIETASVRGTPLTEACLGEWLNANLKSFDHFKAEDKWPEKPEEKRALLAELITGKRNEQEYKKLRDTAVRKRISEAFSDPPVDGTTFDVFLTGKYVQYASLLATQYSPSSNPAPLGFGTLVKLSDGRYSVCLQPECDCVRLKEPTKFPFIILQGPADGGKNLIAVPILDGEPKSLFNSPTMSAIFAHQFEPDTIAKRVMSDGTSFLSLDGASLTFVANLRRTHTQRIVQQLTDNVGRVGVTEGELGRLAAKKRP